MAADTLEGKREAIVTEYMLRILGLDVSRPGLVLLIWVSWQHWQGGYLPCAEWWL